MECLDNKLNISFGAKLKEYVDEKFYRLDFSGNQFEDVIFSHCQFLKCNLNGVKFNKCKFKECEFDHCNLSSADIRGSSFSETVFSNSKLIGINWTAARWPQIKLISPISFYKCNMSHSSFFELSLVELIMESCKAHEIDFRGADLSHSNFVGTDLEKSIFIHTKLNEANFTDSISYNIDTSLNEIKRAKFSFPDVMGLLNHLDIEIKGLD